jgi:hypothetical protein
MSLPVDGLSCERGLYVELDKTKLVHALIGVGSTSSGRNQPVGAIAMLAVRTGALGTQGQLVPLPGLCGWTRRLFNGT